MLSAARPAVKLAAAALLAACMSVAACASASAPKASGPVRHSARVSTYAVQPAPPAGNRAEARALATALLSRLRLPGGARRLPPNAAPRSVSPSLWFGAAAAVDVHELFELPEPMSATAAYFSAHVPPGMSISVTGQRTGSAGQTTAEVAYAPHSVPAGVYAAQLVLTIAPGAARASVIRVDAQVIWYPPRSAAEYIDPARYRVLTVAVTIFNPRLRTISKVIPSRRAITELADTLNRSRVEPIRIWLCPVIFANYRLGFAVSAHREPVVVVTATRNPCTGAQITVDGRKQPPLQDEATVVAVADRLHGLTPQP